MRYNLGWCAGVFDRFHEGHRAIIDRAFEISDAVIIILMETQIPLIHGENLEPKELRFRRVRDYITSKGLDDRTIFEEVYDNHDLNDTRRWWTKAMNVVVTCLQDIGGCGIQMDTWSEFTKFRDRMGVPCVLEVVDAIRGADGKMISSSEMRKRSY